MSKQTKAAKRAASAPINERALLTRRMACDYLSMGGDAFRAYESMGDITGIPFGSGRELRFRRSELDDLIDRMADQTTNLDRKKQSV